VDGIGRLRADLGEPRRPIGKSGRVDVEALACVAVVHAVMAVRQRHHLHGAHGNNLASKKTGPVDRPRSFTANSCAHAAGGSPSGASAGSGGASSTLTNHVEPSLSRFASTS